MNDTHLSTVARRAAKRRKKLNGIIRLVEGKSEGSHSIRCLEWSEYHCSGHMKVNRHGSKCKIWRGEKCDCPIRGRTWVGAHEYPVFAQCSECGFAPFDTMTQTILLGRLLCRRKGKKIKAWWER